MACSGWGPGAIAAYGQPGERITFYEIDPAVEHIAWDPQYFTYLADCRAKVEVALGDAGFRLFMGHRENSTCSCLTPSVRIPCPSIWSRVRRCRLTLQRLADHGLLAIHISSRYLNLKPILGRLAKDARVAARVCTDGAGPRKSPSEWVVIAERTEDFAKFTADAGWRPLPTDEGRVWTDDFSNVVGALQRDFSWSWLWPSEWWRSKKKEMEFHFSMGASLATQKKLEESLAHFRMAVEIAPDDANAHYNLATALQTCNAYDEATIHYRKALTINPEMTAAHCNFASLLARRGRHAGGP